MISNAKTENNNFEIAVSCYVAHRVFYASKCSNEKVNFDFYEDVIQYKRQKGYTLEKHNADNFIKTNGVQWSNSCKLSMDECSKILDAIVNRGIGANGCELIKKQDIADFLDRYKKNNSTDEKIEIERNDYILVLSEKYRFSAIAITDNNNRQKTIELLYKLYGEVVSKMSENYENRKKTNQKISEQKQIDEFKKKYFSHYSDIKISHREDW